jgi:hypothetical protein
VIDEKCGYCGRKVVKIEMKVISSDIQTAPLTFAFMISKSGGFETKYV